MSLDMWGAWGLLVDDAAALKNLKKIVIPSFGVHVIEIALHSTYLL